MKALSLFALKPPEGELVVSYGGGVNTIATLVLLHKLGVVPHAITMAHPGSEWKATDDYRDEVMRPWCRSVGFPEPVVIRRAEEGDERPRAWRLETLYEECMRIKSIPSIAYGYKKCSAKYKAQPQQWWLERQPWAQEAWAAGRKIVKVIGYDVDEGRRVRKAVAASDGKPVVEESRYAYWYPLYEAGLDRQDCMDLIAEAGLPPGHKSACTFCPSNSEEEWIELREKEPARFAEAVAMSRQAEIDLPDIVGLMRCYPHGKRQLHVWADNGCPQGGARDISDDVPCECAT